MTLLLLESPRLLLESPRQRHYQQPSGNGIGAGYITYSTGDGFSHTAMPLDESGSGWDIISLNPCDGTGDGEENALHMRGNGTGNGRDYIIIT